MDEITRNADGTHAQKTIRINTSVKKTGSHAFSRNIHAGKKAA